MGTAPMASLENPPAALRHLLDTALGSCHAGSAGLSLLHDDGAGGTIVRWAAISGAMAAHQGTDTPRDSSPCGLSLDAGTTIRLLQPEHTFASLRDVRPAMVEDLIVPLYDEARKPLGTLWIAHHDRGSHFCADDERIAEHLAAQAVLTLSLLQRAALKDAMLDEVNHRTKNTLQAAGSLLVLQARATSSAEVRIALLDSHARLQLLAKAHELLCTRTDDAQTVLMPELLRTLGDALRQSYAQTSARVSLHLASDSLELPVDQATPLALLANELVTNAYKHAFPNDAAGEIAVSLRQTPDIGLILRVADTGTGLQLARNEIGMGLKLIRSLAAQLRGTLIFAAAPGGPGTVVTLTIATPVSART